MIVPMLARPVHSLCFTQSGAAVQLSSDLPAALEAAAVTLHAYEQESRAADWQVQIHSTPVLPPAASAAAFACAPARDIGRGDTVRAIDAAGSRLFLIDQHQALVVLTPARRQITAYCTREEHAIALAVRLVRQAMSAELLAAGAIYAHAAAARVRGQGVMICGHSGRGKTTTLIALLRHLPGSDFVTNDRLLLRENVGRMVGHAWPSHMRAGVGTLLAYPDLADLAPLPLRHLPPAQRWEAGKVSVEPDQFTRLINEGQIIGSCEVSAVILPVLTPGRHRVGIEPVPPDEVARELAATKLFMRDPDSGNRSHVNHWLIPAPSDPEQDHRIARASRVLADTAPCFRVHGGDDPQALAAAVDKAIR